MKGDEGPWVVLLDGSLCHKPNDYVVAEIVHELAHYHLKHPPSPPKEYADNEKAADEQARKWGFGKEIETYRRKQGTLGGEDDVAYTGETVFEPSGGEVVFRRRRVS